MIPSRGWMFTSAFNYAAGEVVVATVAAQRRPIATVGHVNACCVTLRNIRCSRSIGRQKSQ
jgi:hypothetical protein